jgi:FtsP/CotA-like multicopper oxidase with cupredoxin domain
MSGRDAAGGAAYNMGSPVRSKKMAISEPLDVAATAGLLKPKMVRIGAMARAIFPPNRRELMARLGAAALGSMLPPGAMAQTRVPVALQAKAGVLGLRPGAPDTPVWSLAGPDLRFRRGEALEVSFTNDLPVPTVPAWRGLGPASADALLARRPIPVRATESLQLPLRYAGTFLCDLRLLGDGQARPSRARAMVVLEKEPVAVDRDELLLIEDWRLRPDGTAVAPGTELQDATPVYTINGRVSPDFAFRLNERLRLRFINGCQRAVIAVKLEGFEVRVMAVDSQPAEPFVVRNGTLLLPPGGRTDVFVDVTAAAGSASPILLHDGQQARPIGRMVVASDPPVRAAPLPPSPPLPSNGLPAQLDLKTALRVDVPLGGTQAGWVTPAAFVASAQPAFRAKTGRVVVLALTNRNPIATVFHLHGHHFRLLDRLDDGWKPFWLDTLAIEPGQTQRIAFAAEYTGRWLLESVATDWAAPRLVRWYAVE